MQQGVQMDSTSNNDGSCWPTMVCSFARGFRKMSTAEEFSFERSHGRFYSQRQQLPDCTQCLYITFGGKEWVMLFMLDGFSLNI